MINIDQSLIYIIFLLLAALVLLLVGLVIAYLRLLTKLTSSKSEKLTVDPRNLLIQAQTKGQKILEEAYTKAREILARSDDFSKDQEVKISEELKKSTNIYVNKYQDILEKTQEESIKILQNIPEDIKALFLKEIGEVRKNLIQEVEKVEKDARQIVLDAYQKAEADVEKYKLERMRQVDESIILILKDVARKVLSKEINKEEHEKLVMKALEEAKRQRVFNKQGDLNQPS
ncbi:hypothetical protein A2865_02815 [Candidatus Woesebacteria bacterium RIFCSPHIGHO2_01_FULL_39_17]|uniref:ATP synthase subunit b n=2 Tax=Candidatus Woeseibacteriota TaxID=1752722 RepID=A0A0G0LQ72_9BACT|nr:MAG: ATP synthase subunit b [Microgenomates group bacterium GW2011_GWC1_38_12]KKQ93202.1 MAG: ATP synthase subunit b [Candidatus Woesebacteria bacterium GW2011_GWB1_39_10b]OGM23690.1 MAG: hypothetical protein A2865_02815 [Candidatus Woesebacteria bacterium RIFCSPHIGHO2_01_FULL_39_17]OGM61147.1 MAG: hypothetical protein A3A52_00515 [Candidatus Woesebacteria bacterium RIFCSPLOWO2_01_FULL_39_14]